KALPANILDPAWQSIKTTDDPLAATLGLEADHAVKAGLLKKPDLDGIYDLRPLNKVLKTLGKPTVNDAGYGTK
ncbi:sulfate ABC transporter substrate-binding protein, partial [Streptomyces sp. NPDC059070]